MMKKYLYLCFMMLLTAVSAKAALTVKEQGGWYESCWMEFNGLSSSYSLYNGYVSDNGGASWTKLDGKLLRSYGSYGRVDALGLKAGNYMLKVVPLAGEAEVTTDAVTSGTLEVRSFNREGFAHKTWTTGVGAYNNDGTLKAGAKVFYVSSKTAKTISTDVVTSDKGAKTTCVGFQSIIAAYEKGCDKTPIAFRIVGTVNAEDMDALGSKAEGLQIKGRAADSELNITIEGVGNDAVIYGFGFLVRNSKSVEIRNIAVKTGIDDGISLDTDNSNIWLHNIDVFYGPNKGGDQKKGDGAIDIKSDSKYVTVAYCHFWDTGKSTMCGMKSESGPNYITYHHNWFDHSDSRHARIRTMSVHMYNNYYDGIAKYGSGATTGSSVFMDRNYFRNCSKPMMISLQGADTKYGTDLKDAPTFSGENGGIIKSFGNVMTGSVQYKPYSESNTVEFDCYEVTDPATQVPANVTTKSGGNKYNNFDTNAALMYAYSADNADQVPAVVTNRTWGAGREQGGDFSFAFTDADDKSYDINTALESALATYKTASGFKEFLGEEKAPDASATFTLDGAAVNFTNLAYTKSVAASDTQTEFIVVVSPTDESATVTATGAASTGANTFAIAAPSAGSSATAVFTVSTGGVEMKYTIIIDKTQEEPVSPEQPALEGVTIVYFEQKQAVCDNADASTLFDKGNMTSSTDKGTVSYGGAEFGECVKMESSTEGYITPTSNCNITIVFGSKNSAPKVMIDETIATLTSTGNAYVYTFAGKAGDRFVIHKGNKGTTNTFLYAIVFEPVATGIVQISTPETKAVKAIKYLKDGKLVIDRHGEHYNALGVHTNK